MRCQVEVGGGDDHLPGIAMVSTPFVAVPPPLYGGTELVVHSLTRALERAGHQVVVFATGDSEVARVRALFHEAVWPPDPHAELLHCRFAAREIQAGDFDVVHAHCPFLLAFTPELKTPVVYTLHHDAQPTLSRYYRCIPPASASWPSRRGRPSWRTRPRGASSTTGSTPRATRWSARAAMRALFLGRLSHCKAPDLAVEVAARAGVRLVVAGKVHEGDGVPGRDQLARKALAQPHVRWIQGVDLPAKPASSPAAAPCWCRCAGRSRSAW